MTIAHELFSADSHGVLDYARAGAPPIGRRELSIILINAMMVAAGLDWFERGDVFDQIACLRPGPPADWAIRMEELITQLRTLLTIPALALLTEGGLPQFTRSWLGAFENAGFQFGSAAGQDLLTRGLRAVLAHTGTSRADNRATSPGHQCAQEGAMGEISGLGACGIQRIA